MEAMKVLVTEIKREFEELLNRIEEASDKLVETELSNAEILFLREKLVRAATPVEQCFSGLTSRLWDDPFEWTLPEYISSGDRFDEYLREVRKATEKGFRVILTDEELTKSLPAPEKIATVFKVMHRAIVLSNTSLAIFDYELERRKDSLEPT